MSHLLSIIIPVYNVADCLAKCLDSVIHQTYRNLEIILVNDGSKDDSLKICEEYKNRDQRIVLINKDNGGLSSARNAGMKRVSGDLVAFVDSDDWLDVQMYQKMVALLDERNADIVMCDCFASRNPVGILHGTGVQEYTARGFTEKILRDEIGSQLWKFLYKTKLWDGIVSPDKRHAQDMMILHKVTGRAGKIVTTDEQLYFYNDGRETNTSNSSKNYVKNKMDRAIAFWERLDYAKENAYGLATIRLIAEKALRFTADAFSSTDVLSQRFNADVSYVRRQIWTNRKIIMSLKMPLQQKIRAFIVSFVPHMYTLAYNRLGARK